MPLTAVVRLLGFALLFLTLWLSRRAGMVPFHLRAIPTRLRMTRSHLGLTRLFSHLIGSVSRTSGAGCFSGARFGFVSANILPVLLIFGSAFVAAFASIRGLPLIAAFCGIPSLFAVTFRDVPWLVSRFSRSRCSGFVSRFFCSPSGCCADSLLAALALPHAFVLVE